jgi:omega-amidase
MQDLKIALIQSDLSWENDAANLRHFRDVIERIQTGTHLIVLPEMFATGFTMNAARLAQCMDGPAVSWMVARSRETQAHITGSLIIRDQARFYNRLIWATPDGELYQYDKKHLFRHAGEEKVYSRGAARLRVECRGWRICPFICYDLRFPIWTRNISNAYDAAIYVANWPRQRAAHWKTLLRARAIENQCYVAGVNRVGMDGNGHGYDGDSCIIDPMGRQIAGMHQTASIIHSVLSAETLHRYRRHFPAWMDADGDMVTF